MQIITTPLNGLLVIHPRVFEDERGSFFESYNKNVFHSHGISDEFQQDNQSLSHKGVLRGLHLQHPPFAQAKLVRVVTGSVQDVAVDIRKNSPAYGKYFSMELSGTNKIMLYIPEGFAHGFLVLEDNTVFSYKCSRIYNKDAEDAILWNDSDLGIEWKIKNPVLSEKDRAAKRFRDFTSNF